MSPPPVSFDGGNDKPSCDISGRDDDFLQSDQIMKIVNIPNHRGLYISTTK